MKKKQVKAPKKAVKAVENLHDLVSQLEFFYQASDRFKPEVLKKAMYIEEVLHQLSVDKKIDHARFISKFKHLFAKENEELKEENRELKKKLNKRGKIIGDLIEEVRDLRDDEQ